MGAAQPRPALTPGPGTGEPDLPGRGVWGPGPPLGSAQQNSPPLPPRLLESRGSLTGSSSGSGSGSGSGCGCGSDPTCCCGCSRRGPRDGRSPPRRHRAVQGRCGGDGIAGGDRGVPCDKDAAGPGRWGHPGSTATGAVGERLLGDLLCCN